MAGYYLELRHSAIDAEPHLALAVQLGRETASRAHSDVRGFELHWARTLNALGRHAQCLDALSSPPAALAVPGDAPKLGGLYLELAAAALAMGRNALAAEQVAAATAFWQDRHVAPPPAQVERLAQLQRALAGSSVRRRPFLAPSRAAR